MQKLSNRNRLGHDYNGHMIAELAQTQRGNCVGVTDGVLQPRLLSPVNAAAGDASDGGVGVKREDSECPFWERDMSSLLAENQSLKEALGAAFHNVDGTSIHSHRYDLQYLSII
jgi:hypothetical protein